MLFRSVSAGNDQKGAVSVLSFQRAWRDHVSRGWAEGLRTDFSSISVTATWFAPMQGHDCPLLDSLLPAAVLLGGEILAPSGHSWHFCKRGAPMAGLGLRSIGAIGEGGQKVQTSGYKMNKPWGRNVQHGDHS